MAISNTLYATFAAILNMGLNNEMERVMVVSIIGEMPELSHKNKCPICAWC